MRTLFAIALLAVCAAVPSARAAHAVGPAESEALLRIASRLSGLPAERAVPVVVDRPARFKLRRVRTLERQYPLAKQAYDEVLYRSLGITDGRNVLGRALAETNTRRAIYDPTTRRVYVPRGRPARTTLLKELVHALQDQHFDLRRAGARVAGNRDATLAAAAGVNGHATLVAGVLAARSLSEHGGPLLTRFLQLERGFTNDVGLRFAANLRNLGGNRALLAALRRLPESTEQVFHLDKFLEREQPVPIVLPVDAAGLALAGDNTFGELDVRALLAVFDVPRLAHAGSGWGGGRSAVYRAGGREAVALALDWDTELDAEQWAEAAALYVNEAFAPDEPGLPPSATCAASVCWNLGDRGVAFVREGVRTSLVVSGDAATAAAVARALVPATG